MVWETRVESRVEVDTVDKRELITAPGKRDPTPSCHIGIFPGSLFRGKFGVEGVV